jgi:SPP1 family predicted phage head-tail adaptor
MIDAGKLRHRIRIEAPVPMTDSAGDVVQDAGTGEVTREWVLLGEVWAAVEPLSAKEFIQSQEIQSRVVARITFRRQTFLPDASNRIVHGERIYNIEGVLADKSSGLEYLTCPCSQGVSDSGQ